MTEGYTVIVLAGALHDWSLSPTEGFEWVAETPAVATVLEAYRAGDEDQVLRAVDALYDWWTTLKQYVAFPLPVVTLLAAAEAAR